MKRDSTAVMARRHVVEEPTPLLTAMGGGQPVLRPSGHTAVMSSRAATAPDELDYFPTPPWAARAGGELVRTLDRDPQATCWEPACGEGHMAYGLRDHFAVVESSDVFDYGAGAVFDFLSDAPPLFGADWIISNPPFKVGELFVRRALVRARRGVAMLLRLVFLEGGRRFHLFNEHPLEIVAPFSERVPMVKGRWDPDASSATAYAWFIWDKRGDGGAQVRFIGPGTKARLSKPEDRARYGLQDLNTPLRRPRRMSADGYMQAEGKGAGWR